MKGGDKMNRSQNYNLKQDKRTEFVKDTEGAELARMSVGTFRRLADEFGCVYRIGRARLTNWEEFKAGLENYRS